MTTTLTNDQITAGAAVLCDHGQPIGRNAAIEVADAMQAAGPAMADLDLDKLQQHATMFRDIESFHPGHFRTLKIFANNTLDLIGLARCAPSPQVAEKVKDAELIELAKLAGYTFARTTTAGVELLAGNVEAHERLMSFGALAIAASRRAAGGEASAALREAASDYANGTDWVQRSTVVAWLRARAGFATPAPASAGQATPAAARNYRDEEFLTAARVALVALAHAAEKHGIYQTDHDRFAAAVEKFAAQPAEVSAGQAGQVATPALIQALETGDERESHKWFDIHPSEVPFYKEEGYRVRMLYEADTERAAAPADGDILRALRDGIPLQEPVYIGKALLAKREARVSLASGTAPVACAMLVNIQLTSWADGPEKAEAFVKGYNTALDHYRNALLGLVATRTAEGADKRDAERWRAFINSPRIRIIGSAGLNGDTDPNGNPHGNYAHFGMEIWSVFGRNYSAALLKDLDDGNVSGRALLVKYANKCIAAQAAHQASAPTGDSAGRAESGME